MTYTRIDQRAVFRDAKLQPSENPMTALYGIKGELSEDGREYSGPTCGGCYWFVVHRHARNYYKCWQRGLTHGPGTDQRMRWPACGLYQEREGPIVNAWAMRDRERANPL